MKFSIVTAAALVVAALTMPAYADAATTATHTRHTQPVKKHSARHFAQVPRPSNHEVTYDRDAKDPNIGWHSEGGLRVCKQDCDNPEIPGSGYTCRDINFLGMRGRECDYSIR